MTSTGEARAVLGAAADAGALAAMPGSTPPPPNDSPRALLRRGLAAVLVCAGLVAGLSSGAQAQNENTLASSRQLSGVDCDIAKGECAAVARYTLTGTLTLPATAGRNSFNVDDVGRWLLVANVHGDKWNTGIGFRDDGIGFEWAGTPTVTKTSDGTPVQSGAVGNSWLGQLEPGTSYTVSASVYARPRGTLDWTYTLDYGIDGQYYPEDVAWGAVTSYGWTKQAPAQVSVGLPARGPDEPKTGPRRVCHDTASPTPIMAVVDTLNNAAFPVWYVIGEAAAYYPAEMSVTAQLDGTSAHHTSTWNRPLSIDPLTINAIYGKKRGDPPAAIQAAVDNILEAARALRSAYPSEAQEAIRAAIGIRGHYCGSFGVGYRG